MKDLLRLPLRLLLGGLMVVTMSACDSNDVDEDDLEGVWRLVYVEENGVKEYPDEGEDVFFVFKTNEFVLYMNFGACYFRISTPVTDREGDEWETGDGNVEVKLNGNQLTFTDEDGAKTVLEKSSRAESSFTPICDGMDFKSAPTAGRLMEALRNN